MERTKLIKLHIYLPCGLIWWNRKAAYLWSHDQCGDAPTASQDHIVPTDYADDSRLDQSCTGPDTFPRDC